MLFQYPLFLLSSGTALTAASLLPKWSRARPDMCGVKGEADPDNNYFQSSSAALASYSGCSARCAASSRCKSFGFGDAGCLLFDQRLAGNLDADRRSLMVYYDAACASGSSVSSAAAATQSASSRVASPESSASRGRVSTARATQTRTMPAPNGVFNTTHSTNPGPSGNSSTDASIPAGCDIPQSFTVTGLAWFNSSQNLDCVNANYDNSTSRVCYNAQSQLCDPATAVADGCTCSPYCASGMPRAAYQPPGYGPADMVTVSLAGLANGTCQQANPQSTRRAEVGNGNVDCGSATNIMNFYGDSNGNGTIGQIDFHPPAVACDGKAAVYGASFPLLCTRDASNNATCITSEPVTLSFTGFDS